MNWDVSLLINCGHIHTSQVKLHVQGRGQNMKEIRNHWLSEKNIICMCIYNYYIYYIVYRISVYTCMYIIYIHMCNIWISRF